MSRKKDSYTVGGKVVMDFDDGSCVLQESDQYTVCYNPYRQEHFFLVNISLLILNNFSGSNLYVKRLEAKSKDCQFLPTRKEIVHGKFLTQGGRKVFMSSKTKVLFQVKDNINLCGCAYNYRLVY